MRVLGDGTQLEQETFPSHICDLKVMCALLFAVSVPVFNRGSSWVAWDSPLVSSCWKSGTDIRSGLDFTHCVTLASV